MMNEFVDITTDMLLELVVAVLEAGRPLTSERGCTFTEVTVRATAKNGSAGLGLLGVGLQSYARAR